ncbi:MAG: hypothetical protein EA365_04915 [Gloeocapsa sp. DLM2.Bin57]|nr:MAG: hypothetical protein EA365_04915 [Gloeocapsa sp. DLM2.Bin57]
MIMLTTKVINSWNCLDNNVEIYLTEMDAYIKNNLGINCHFMLVILLQIEINNNLEQSKDKLRDNFLKFCQKLQNYLIINIIDPATGIFLDNCQYNIYESIDIPRVISRLENNCYQYQECCQGKHHRWGDAVYPALILLDSTTPAEITAILNKDVKFCNNILSCTNI